LQMLLSRRNFDWWEVGWSGIRRRDFLGGPRTILDVTSGADSDSFPCAELEGSHVQDERPPLFS